MTYRRIVHQRQQNQKQFLNSIPHRVQVKPVLFVWVLTDMQSQEYGTEYWTAVRGVGMVMESLANYLRYAQEHWNWKLWQLIVLPGIYQVLVIPMDQHSGHRPRISSLLLMQTTTRRPLSSRIGNHQSSFHQSTIRILDLDHPLPAAKQFYLDVHWSFVLLEN